MPVVEVDAQGKMIIPKEMGIRNSQAIVIPAGSFFITIPIPKCAPRQAQNWLPTSKSSQELKKEVEELASKDAVERAKRRRQL